MVQRSWVNPLIGLVVALMLYALILPLFSGAVAQVFGPVLLIAAAVCAILLVVSFLRN